MFVEIVMTFTEYKLEYNSGIFYAKYIICKHVTRVPYSVIASFFSSTMQWGISCYELHIISYITMDDTLIPISHLMPSTTETQPDKWKIITFCVRILPGTKQDFNGMTNSIKRTLQNLLTWQVCSWFDTTLLLLIRTQGLVTKEIKIRSLSTTHICDKNQAVVKVIYWIFQILFKTLFMSYTPITVFCNYTPSAVFQYRQSLFLCFPCSWISLIVI